MAEPCEVRPIAEPEVAVLDAAYPEHESRHQHHFRQQLAGEGTYFVAWSGEDPAGWVFLSTPTMHPLARWAARSCPTSRSPPPTAAPALAAPCSTPPSGPPVMPAGTPSASA